MSRNNTYDQSAQFTELLEKHYREVRQELQTVALQAAQEEVRAIAAQHEDKLRELIQAALRKQGGVKWRQLVPQSVPAMVMIALVVAVAVVAVPKISLRGLMPGRDAEAARAAGAGAGGGEETSPRFPEVDLDPLRELAAERYDLLFARHDPAFGRLIERAMIAGEVRSDTVAEVLGAWRAGDTLTAGQEQIMHAAVLQAALRELTGNVNIPVNGRVNRAQCEQDLACQEVLRRWRADRLAGLRLLEAVSDAGSPAPQALRLVEKLFVYEQLAARADDQ
jgi:hypothetical protein